MNRIFIVFYCLIILSCNGDLVKKNKLLIKKDANGIVTLKAPYHLTTKGDTLIDGTVVTYYRNGNIEDSFQMNKGVREGFYFQFDSSGTLKSKMQFVNGKREGLSFRFYPNKKTEVEELFRSDSLLYSKNYFINGQLRTYFIFIELRFCIE